MKITKLIKKISKKSYISALLIVILFIVVSSGFLYWQRQQKYNSEDGLTWRTYKGDYYEIKYPWSWARVEQQGTNAVNGNTSAISIGPGDENLNEIRIWGFNITGWTLDQAFGQLSKDMIVKNKKASKINGYPAIRYILTNALMENSSGNLGMLIKNPTGDGAYAVFSQVNYTVQDNGKVNITEATTKLFDQIILSFRYFD